MSKDAVELTTEEMAALMLAAAAVLADAPRGASEEEKAPLENAGRKAAAVLGVEWEEVIHSCKEARNDRAI